MDRVEAIEILAGRYLIAVEDSKTAKDHTRRVNEALDLAIEALEREVEYGQMVVDFTKGETMNSDEWKYDTTCNAETATTTDCISRADTIKALCRECKVFPDDVVNCADCTEVAIVKGMPTCNQTCNTCNQKQVTGKLNNPDDSLLTEDSDGCKEQKSKLELEKFQLSQETSTNSNKNSKDNLSFSKKENDDLISRQAAIEEIALHDCTNGEVPYFTGKGVQEILNILPPVEPKKKVVAQIKVDTDDIMERIKEEYEIIDRPVCEDTISRQAAIEYIDNYAHLFTTGDYFEGMMNAVNLLKQLDLFPPVEPKRPKGTETMMVDGEPMEIDPLSYEVGYTHGQFSDRPKGEWIDRGDYAVCSRCAGISWQQMNGVEIIPFKSKYCPDCGADMRGDKE